LTLGPARLGTSNSVMLATFFLLESPRLSCLVSVEDSITKPSLSLSQRNLDWAHHVGLTKRSGLRSRARSDGSGQGRHSSSSEQLCPLPPCKPFELWEVATGFQIQARSPSSQFVIECLLVTALATGFRSFGDESCLLVSTSESLSTGPVPTLLAAHPYRFSLPVCNPTWWGSGTRSSQDFSGDSRVSGFVGMVAHQDLSGDGLHDPHFAA